MKRLIFPVLLGLALVGCDSSKNETATDAPTQTTVSETRSPILPPMPTAEPIAAPVSAVANTAPVAKPTRDIIYQGELNLAVTDFNQATTRINQLLELHDAYLCTAHETRAAGQHSQDMTIKVVPGKFVELVTALSQLGYVENKDVASADVTADMLQTAKTLAAKQVAATKLQQQLAKITNKDEASRLQTQASQLQADLAIDQAKLQQIGARSTWATLRLHYYQPLAATDTDEPTLAFAPQFQVAFNRGWSVVLSIAVVLTNIWPLLVLSGLGTWGRRWWRLRHPEQA